MGEMVEFAANGGTAKGYLATPASGSGPGLVVLQEWWGLVPHIQDVADRFAAAGFVALAPDIYDGESTGHPDEAGRMMMALNIEETAKKLRGAAQYLLAQESVTSAKVGTLGFCMGGMLSLFGATVASEVGAAVSFYGIHPNISPDFSKLQGPVLCHWAENDGFIPAENAKGLTNAISEAGGSVTAHWYPAGHAFFNDTRADAHDATQAQVAWDRSVAFLQANLA